MDEQEETSPEVEDESAGETLAEPPEEREEEAIAEPFEENRESFAESPRKLFFRRKRACRTKGYREEIGRQRNAWIKGWWKWKRR